MSDMKLVVVDGRTYWVDICYTGESSIYDEQHNKINSDICGELYYTILCQAKYKPRKIK